MALIERAAYLASVGLAQERGAFPLFDAKAYGAQGHASRLDPDIRDAISENGIRNGLLTSIAPTGTISLLAGNVSSGIEPIFSIRYERKILQADGNTPDREGHGLCRFAVVGDAWRRRALCPRLS